MNYSHITDEMTWSYSRLTTFIDCPYRFYLTYIHRSPKIRLFFSDYGTFMHLIIQKYLTGELRKEDLPVYYLSRFQDSVIMNPPSTSIFHSYFSQGIDYLRNIERDTDEIIGVEKEVSFEIDGYRFIGYIDKVSKNDGIDITDNKSRALKPRTNRKKKTKSDIELDEYLRQLYIYSIPIEQEFGVTPNRLIFNCFRTQTKIIEAFNTDAYEETKKWAIDTIENISKETNWNPNIEWFKCKYICDCNHACEYFKMFGGDQ